MKLQIHPILFPALAAGFAITSVEAAPLAPGTKIGLDFGPTLTTNWNNITSDGQSIAAGAVVNLSGASLDGVSITTAKGAGTGFFSNNDGTNNWVGLATNGGSAPVDFVDSVTTDINGVVGGTDTYTITLGGLGTSLRYNIHAVTVAGYDRTDGLTVVGDATYGPSSIARSSSRTGAFHAFLNVGADGAGNLTITLTDLGSGNNPVVNGILIQAVGPPATLWVLDGDGDWNTPDNWSPNTVPSGQSAAAILASDGGAITGPVTATLDVPVTLGSLGFDHAFAYTVAGANALTFDNAGGGAGVEVKSGAHAISAPVTLADSLAATVAAGAALDLSGPLSDGGSARALVKSGTGNLVLSGDISGFTGLTTISAGTVTLPQGGDYILAHRFAGAGRLAITGGGRVTLAPASANSHGGTDVSNGGALVVDAAGDLGAGGVGFDNGTLEVGGNITAGTGGWIARAGGGVIEVGAGLTLQGGGLTGTGAMNKTGEGTWRVAPGGGGVTIGTLTVGAGTLGAVANAGINIGGYTNLGGGLGSDLTFNVADVTDSSAPDLTVSAVLKNNYTAGAFAPLINGLVKTGGGTLELTAVNRYTGATSVEAGTLILGQAFLDDDADVALSTGATLQLDFAGTDTIGALVIDGSPQAAGTWGRTGHPDAEHTTSLITGDGLLQVAEAGYDAWAGLFAGFTNTAADLDFENDGLASGVEWVVDGDPTANDAAAVAPTFDNRTDPDDFLFIFRRRDDAAADPNTTIVVEYGSDLSGWRNTAEHGQADGVTIAVDDDGFGTSPLDGTGVDKVTVAIPRALAPDGRLFARLRVDVVAP
jgi:autotransporter-associated beta strand protein